jgi:hypothetical protein
MPCLEIHGVQVLRRPTKSLSLRACVAEPGLTRSLALQQTLLLCSRNSRGIREGSEGLGRSLPKRFCAVSVGTMKRVPAKVEPPSH